MAVFDWRSAAEWKRLFRYYQAGIANTLFGFGLYALLVWLGLNMFVAQILAHLLGVAFNYLTYSRYAFADHQASRSGFVAAYALNYLLSLAILWSLDRVGLSPYLAGFATIILVSALNYLVLRNAVFRTRRI